MRTKIHVAQPDELILQMLSVIKGLNITKNIYYQRITSAEGSFIDIYVEDVKVMTCEAFYES